MNKNDFFNTDENNIAKSGDRTSKDNSPKNRIMNVIENSNIKSVNHVWENDVFNVINNFDMSMFKDKTILITGATGLIGKLCTKSLLSSGYNTKIIALVRNRSKAVELFGKDENISYLVQDVTQKIQTDCVIDYIIHAAAPTSSKKFIDEPTDVIDVIYSGTKNVLELAKVKNICSMVNLSSFEIYGTPGKKEVKENDYGYLDPLNPRNSYTEAKRIAENLCIAYASEYKVPVKIARLAQTFGSGVVWEDNRVFAQFAKSVVKKQNITLHTKGLTERNYCDVSDAVRAVFTILVAGQNGEAYNVANKDTYISIRDMAKMLENENSKVVFDLPREDCGYKQEIKIFLNTDKLESLGWHAACGLEEMFAKTIASLKEKE